MKFRAFDDNVISCPGLTCALGTSFRRPSIATWPWETSWRAWLVVSARPRRRHTVSRRVDRKSTRLNSSHPSISYAVFCLKKKKKKLKNHNLSKIKNNKQNTK